MTTVVICNYTKAVYSDSRCTTVQGGVPIQVDTAQKVYKLKDGRVFVGTGTVSTINEIKDHVDNFGTFPTSVNNCYDCTAFVVEKVEDYIEVFSMNVKRKFFGLACSITLDTDSVTGFLTAGSGNQFAAGVMSVLHDAKKAIETASEFDKFTDDNVQVEYL